MKALADNKRGESIICAWGEGGTEGRRVREREYRILRLRDKKRSFALRSFTCLPESFLESSNIAIIVGETTSQFFPSLREGNACKKNQIGNRGLLQPRRGAIFQRKLKR